MSYRGDHDRLLQLSEDASRIAVTLAQLSNLAVLNSTDSSARRDSPDVDAELVKWLIKVRRHRTRYLPHQLFSEPAWDMLLELLHAELTHRRVSVSALCAVSGVPSTTALRWLTMMVENSVLVRREDENDRRRAFVELAPNASESLRRYFVEVVKSEMVTS
jgi:DNA-binding MarR family transcriptional regulator